MSTALELMGLGMPPALASRLGNTPASVNGNGTGQTGATLINSPVNLITPSSGNTAFVLSNSLSTGRPVWLWNQSTTVTALVFPPSGASFVGGSANGSISIPPATGAVVQLLNGEGVSAELWGVNLSAVGAGGVSGAIVLPANTATLTPLTFKAGTLNTTPAAGGMEFDGNVLYFDAAASQRGEVPVESLIYVQAAITLVSQTGAQAAFVGSSGGVLTNGEITLPLGTFQFEAEFNISAMSSTSGGFGFALGTANSAVIGQQSWSAYANKATLATPAAPQFSWNTTASTELATASTATVGFVRLEGTFTLTTAGSIIPQLSFTTVAGSAAPIVGVGSYFKIRSLGSATVSYVGNWS